MVDAENASILSLRPADRRHRHVFYPRTRTVHQRSEREENVRNRRENVAVEQIRIDGGETNDSLLLLFIFFAQAVQCATVIGASISFSDKQPPRVINVRLQLLNAETLEATSQRISVK